MCHASLICRRLQLLRCAVQYGSGAAVSCSLSTVIDRLLRLTQLPASRFNAALLTSITMLQLPGQDLRCSCQNHVVSLASLCSCICQKDLVWQCRLQNINQHCRQSDRWYVECRRTSDVELHSIIELPEATL